MDYKMEKFNDFYYMPATFDITSTAGAVPVKNEKGELSMQKVKVHRYVSGKRPEYAQRSSSEDESEDEDFITSRKHKRAHTPEEKAQESDDSIPDDPRLRRLKSRHVEEVHHKTSDDEIERRRPRRIQEPEVLEDEEEVESEIEVKRVRGVESSEEEEEEDLSDTEIERRRLLLKQRVLSTKEQMEVELLDKEEEGQSEQESEEESSEYEEYSDSEEETGVRLKPVFVRKKERVTILEKEREALKKKEFEMETKKMAEERRKQTLKMVEEEIRKETNKTRIGGEEVSLGDVNTDDENDEVEYEAWKQRELKRIKRDRDLREQLEREKMEIERIRNLTEEERRNEFRNNPKHITNKGVKGKYKFMQKYYHRGAFFMDKDEEIFTRDFSEATLEDHFDKTILPRVMQVKNFGRSGRTKYTHLVDQDTTQFDSPWISETAHNLKFHNNQAAGCKQVFDRPSNKRK
ncbi:microfibrillar-associated protein 1 [Cimex lectularius]|uniref:Micro-fibrillar-associated protein 1 C-terminal domain-containing protein n=1 Tax=Cimex lectularius TaxID=79782 RepID=A0A8I6SNY9_CIMLE|nr:microfibrillar-associated protein 1 [Cimex lectularius]